MVGHLLSAHTVRSRHQVVLLRALRQLPRAQQALICRRFFRHQTVRDIAHAWRCSEAQVQQLQHPALTELRRRTAPPAMLGLRTRRSWTPRLAK